MRTRWIVLAASLAAALAVPAAAPLAAEEAPSRFGIDAPELARVGPASVGVRTLVLIQPAQADLNAVDARGGAAPLRDRVLKVDLWYPARARVADVREIYHAAFPAEPPAPPVPFSVAGIAVRNAPAAGSGYPLVIVSHGYSNATAAMTWITENLASKGYVVAAIRHEDPPIGDLAGLPELLLRRPLDIAFVAKTLPGVLAARRLVDPTRTALIGYSMGGYGVLAAAGATLDASGRTVQLVPDGLLLPFASGGARRDEITVKGLRAVVAISPVGGGELGAWGSDGLRTLRAPLLLISGDQDRVVDYASGARRFFDAAVNADRYLLTFKGAGHSIGSESGACGDASPPLGSGLVRGSGLEKTAGQRHQRAFHHGFSRFVSQRRSEPRGLPRCRGARVERGNLACIDSIRLRRVQPRWSRCHGLEGLSAQS